jgi:uncharacterized membrane protein YozB (DUF420 family)
VTWTQLHPALNAVLNFTSFILLVLGLAAIRQRRERRHKRFMLGAATVSTVFLISYLIRFATTGAHKYPHPGWDRTFYFVILFSHMICAVAVLPLVIRTLFLGLRDRRDNHRRLARWTYPIWLYVSVTGVVVYVMLYHVGPRL